MAQPASKPASRTIHTVEHADPTDGPRRVDSTSRQSPFRVVRSSSHAPIDIDRLASIIRKILDEPNDGACFPGPTERGMSVR